jgi:protein involved in polysaccharide export with SLBB domain
MNSERTILITAIPETTVLEAAISETMTSDTMTSDTMINQTTIPETWKPRSESSEIARRCITATVLLGLLALPGAGWTQTTLHTPAAAADDPQCVGDNCAAAPRASAGMANPAAGKAGNQALAAPLPTEAPPNRALPNRNEKEEEGGNAPPEPLPNEFQEFVASSIGRRLPIYGYSLFDHVPTTFAPVDRIPVTDDYLIGPGDEILIRAWGQIDLDGKLVVDRGGEVFLPKVGGLSVAGLKYQQLPEYFRTAIGRVFRNFDLTVSLGQLRSIQIFVVGQARRPGSYTVSSLSTLVNALFASGGPSSAGSMRHIQLKRNNRPVTEFDFYDLLLKGDKSKDARLLPGDVIYIPPAGPSIAIDGSVNVPAIYELRDGTSLRNAVEMAGGLATTADGQKATVERIDNHTTRRVEEFPLDGQGLERALKDGDVIRIFSLSPHFENAVTLRGNVAHPGRVAWHNGMRLKEVLPNQDALVTRDYWRATNSVANERGGERDASPFERQPASAKAATEVTTAKLRNQITRNAPEINWDYAVIQRLNPEDLTARLIPFDLGKLVLQGDEQNNLALEPGDIITVFSQNDLAVPLAKQNKFVRLEGEFRTAGVYRAEPGETVRHLVARAGGFTPNAYLYGSEFTRESVRLDQQKGLDQMIEKLEQDISRNALAPSGASPEEAADSRAKLEAQRQLVGKLREVKATGRVVLDLKPDSAAVGDLPEIALEDGDRYVVPYRPSTVEMLGAVYNTNSFLYRREQRVDDYLRRAGGPTRDADTGRMFVIRADGSVLSRQSVKGLWNGGFASLRLMPGDAIVVPERLNHGSVLKGLRDWSQVFAQFALGAAAVRVIQ